MKNLNQYIITCFLYLMVSSCSNDFLMKEEAYISTTSASEIYISPGWGKMDYSFHITDAGNAEFKIVKTPDWLNVTTSSGQFVNNIATINCNASVRSDFSEIGIYKGLMLLEIGDQRKVYISVSYVTEGNPQIDIERSITFNNFYNYNSRPFVIKNKGQGILLFTIVEKPKWITLFQSGEIIPDNVTFPILPNSEISFDLLYNGESSSSSELLNGKIFIKCNDKSNNETVTDIYYDTGNPLLYCNTNEINFARRETIQEIYLRNVGTGLLTWEVESCPEWMTVSETKGILSTDSRQYLTFTRNISLMQEGHQVHTIYLKTNDKNNPLYAITVSAVNYIPNPENIRTITGTVTDVWMDKTTDILYLTTKQPNRLLAYNTKTRTIDRELVLTKAPNCFSVSEDGHKAIIGHWVMISVVDMDNFSVIKTIEVDYNLFDIEWGANNWCCYTPGSEVQHYILQWKNIDTEETDNMSFDAGSLYSGTLIKKIPYQDYIIASKIRNIPSGITIFDTQNRSESQYFHQDFHRFWFSSDGNYVYCTENQIFEVSSLLNPANSYVAPIGNFSPSLGLTYWMDHCAASHSVWVLSAISIFNETQREIYQYLDNDYTRVKTYYYDDYYNKNLTMAHYVFANSTGNELIVIKNIASDNNDLNGWLIEHITVKD